MKSEGKRWFGEQRVHVCCSFSHSVLKNRFVVFNYALTNAFDFTYVHVVHAQTNENVKQTISGPIRRRLIRPAQLINLIDYSTNHFCGFVCGLIQNFNVFFKYFSQVILRTLTFNYVRKGVKTGKVENYWAKSRVFTPRLGKKSGRKLKVNNLSAYFETSRHKIWLYLSSEKLTPKGKRVSKKNLYSNILKASCKKFTYFMSV